MLIPEPQRLPSGTWRIRVTDPGGVRHSITRATRAECLAAAAQIKTGAKRPAKRPQAALRLQEAYDSYIAECADRRLSPATIAGYQRLARNTMQGLMGLQLRSITPQRIQGEITAMIARGLTHKYQANALGLLHSVLQSQGIRGLTEDIQLSPTVKVQPELLETEDVAAVLEAVKGTPMELPVLLAVWMGLRMSEIRGLRYRDIRGGRLRIVNAIVDGPDGEPVEKTTKTTAGTRWISLPDYIRELIPEGDPDDHIVHLTGQAIYKRWIRLLNRLGIPRCRFHDLRHVNAAIMLSLGIDSRYAQQRNGWASDYMYRQVYGYCLADGTQAANAAVNGWFEQLIQPASPAEMATKSDTE